MVITYMVTQWGGGDLSKRTVQRQNLPQERTARTFGSWGWIRLLNPDYGLLRPATLTGIPPAVACKQSRATRRGIKHQRFSPLLFRQKFSVIAITVLRA